MAELEKMRRTASRVVAGAPHEVWLVLDATTGQNGLEQARKFHRLGRRHGPDSDQASTARPRAASSSPSPRELNLPIRFIGVGEQADDLLAVRPRTLHRIALRTMNTHYLAEVLDLARQGLGRTSPNPNVGAILVREWRSGRARLSYLDGRAARRNRRSRRRRRACPRRDAVHQSRTLLPPGPHRTVRRGPRPGRRGARRGDFTRTPTRWSRAAVSRCSARAVWRSRSTLRWPTRPKR